MVTHINYNGGKQVEYAYNAVGNYEYMRGNGNGEKQLESQKGGLKITIYEE